MNNIIIARFNEELNWVNNVTEKYNFFVYDKGDKSDCHHVSYLENVGRESNTFLHYIVTNYNNLGEYNVFLQGNPFRETPNIVNILNNLKESESSVVSISTIFSCDINGAPHHNGLPLTEFCDLFQIKKHQKFNFMVGQQFYLHKSIILKKPLSYYANLLDYTKTREISPWVFERMWFYVFSDEGEYLEYNII